MDTNLVFAFLTIIIILLVVSEVDEAILLFIFAFAIVSISWNLETLFSVTSTSYSSFGKLLIFAYWGAAVFCFGKAALTGYEGITILRKRRV